MSTARVTRRPALPEDRDFCWRVYASTRADELALVSDWNDEQKAAFTRQQFEAQDAYYREHYPGAEFHVLQAQGRDVGRLYVHRRADEIRLMDVALLPEARGAGLGTLVLRELQDEARAVGKPLRIHVERFNPALRLYERLGFKALEDRGVYLFLEWSPEGAAPDGSQPSA